MPKVILDRFGIIHFFMIFLKLLNSKVSMLCAAVLGRVSSFYNNSWMNLFYKRNLSMGETDVFFLFIAPEKNKKYNSKVCHFWALAPGEGTLD